MKLRLELLTDKKKLHSINKENWISLITFQRQDIPIICTEKLK
jgi:hypothetical protein